MNISKKIISFGALILLGTLAYFFMHSGDFKQTPPRNSIKVGVTAGPHAMIMEKVKEIALKSNLHIEIVEFNDFIIPNEALHQGEIDINVYQHKPFLDQQVETRKYKIVSIGDAVLMPLGIYSKRYKKVSDIPSGSTIAIPNDPTNGSRALLLLQKAGVIKISNAHTPTVMDITENPKNIKFIEMDAPQLPRTLEDLAASVINTDWVIVAKLDPRDAIYKENKDSIYMNIIATHENKKNDPRIQKFKEIYHSKAVIDFIKKKFDGLLIIGDK